MKLNDAISKLSLNELNMLAKMFDDNDQTIIFNDDDFKIKRPQHCYDMNYSIYDKNKNITYLVDIEDVENINDYTAQELIDLSWETL